MCTVLCIYMLQSEAHIVNSCNIIIIVQRKVCGLQKYYYYYYICIDILLVPLSFCYNGDI